MQERDVDRLKSDSQFLTATVTAAGKYTTAVLGAHTGTETMNLVALAFLRLISAFHCSTTPSNLQNAFGICNRIHVIENHHKTAIIVYPQQAKLSSIFLVFFHIFPQIFSFNQRFMLISWCRVRRLSSCCTSATSTRSIIWFTAA